MALGEAHASKGPWSLSFFSFMINPFDCELKSLSLFLGYYCLATSLIPALYTASFLDLRFIPLEYHPVRTDLAIIIPMFKAFGNVLILPSHILLCLPFLCHHRFIIMSSPFLSKSILNRTEMSPEAAHHRPLSRLALSSTTISPPSAITLFRDPVKRLAKTQRYAIHCISSLAKQVT